MKMETAKERNRQALRYLRKQRERRLLRAFDAIPQDVKNTLSDVMRDPRVKNRHEEATRRLGRRPLVIEWMWAMQYDWDLVWKEWKE